MRKLVPLLILLGLCVSLNAGIPGDINDDRFVDLLDIGFIADQWLWTPGDPNADISPLPAGDGAVDFLDFALVAHYWLFDPNEMSFVPGGEFQMGDSFGDSIDPEFPDPNYSDELPLHNVTIDSFYMGKYEITNDQYCTFLNSVLDSNSVYVSADVVYGSEHHQPYCDTSESNPNNQIAYAGGVFSVQMKGSRDMLDDPMVRVSWYGAAAYCNWRSEQDGYGTCYDMNDPNWPCDFAQNGYRLPTEAEWEYAARGGLSGNRFPWGDAINHDYANYNANGAYYSYDTSPYTTFTFHPTWNDEIPPLTAPVGSFSQNGFGLYDITGNVWEWCNDLYDEDYYSISPVNNPTGPISSPYPSPNNYIRVFRGGGYDRIAELCRISIRTGKSPDGISSPSGFRVCRNN